MQAFRLPRTVLNLTRPRGLPSLRDGAQDAEDRQADETTISPELDEELKMPKKASLAIMIMANVMLQVIVFGPSFLHSLTASNTQLTFFIIVSSSNDYAQHLGGTSTFSGLVIGIPTAVSGLTLLPLMHFDQGNRSRSSSVPFDP